MTCKTLIRGLWLATLLAGTAAGAQGFPERPITLVVPFAANGPTDTIARTIGAAMAKQLKQPIVVENVGGAGGTVGAAQVAQADADGYTVLLHHIGMATSPALHRRLAFDPLRDFETIGEVTDVPMTLVARADFPAKSMKEALAVIKAQRGQLRVAHAGPGSAAHLCGLLIMSAVGIDLKTVAYKGTGPAMNDLLAGKVDLMCDQTTNTTPQIRAGTVRALGISTAKRVATLPEIAPIGDAVPHFELAVWHALYVPRGTPKPVVDKLTAALQAALQDSGVRARLNDLGTDPVPLDKATPKFGREHLAAELARWAPIIQRAGEYAD